MTGAEVKALIKASGLKCWQVAAELGLNDGNFSRRLRKPFNDAEIDRISTAIKKVKSAELSEE